jgi:hypothetical protein
MMSCISLFKRGVTIFCPIAMPCADSFGVVSITLRPRGVR